MSFKCSLAATNSCSEFQTNSWFEFQKLLSCGKYNCNSHQWAGKTVQWGPQCESGKPVWNLLGHHVYLRPLGVLDLLSTACVVFV